MRRTGLFFIESLISVCLGNFLPLLLALAISVCTSIIVLELAIRYGTDPPSS